MPAALIAISKLSRSRSSPMTITSGFWRKMCLRPSANEWVSAPTSRWFTFESLWRKVYSIGSSMVTMFALRERLMYSTR